MTELITTTIMRLTNACILVAGFAVTARIWPVCENPDCAEEDGPIIAQPTEQWLPVAFHVEGQVWGGLMNDIVVLLDSHMCDEPYV
jgi:hypothetical protein